MNGVLSQLVLKDISRVSLLEPNLRGHRKVVANWPLRTEVGLPDEYS